MRNMVRIRYFNELIKDFAVSGIIPLSDARKIVASGYYKDAQIVKDEFGFPPFVAAAQERAA